MVEVIYTDKFEKEFKKSDSSIKEKAKKQIQKIIENPEIGKPLRYNLKGERTVYVWPFRIIYSFFDNIIYFLRLEHRKEVYEK
jgi:mRNA-degrading endonuclease RelE of RelBE toxin-antitoxin system